MQYANQINAAYVIVVGENELKEGIVELKEMSTGEKRSLPLASLAAIMKYEKQSDEILNSFGKLSQPFKKHAEAEYFINKVSDTIIQTAKATDSLKKAVEQMKQLLE